MNKTPRVAASLRRCERSRYLGGRRHSSRTTPKSPPQTEPPLNSTSSRLSPRTSAFRMTGDLAKNPQDPAVRVRLSLAATAMSWIQPGQAREGTPATPL